MVKRRVEDVKLYHGSLNELNSRDPKRQYKFAKEPTILLVHDIVRSSQIESRFKNDLFERGYDGIVNRKTTPYFYKGDFYLSHISKVFVEGTPAKLVGS